MRDQNTYRGDAKYRKDIVYFPFLRKVFSILGLVSLISFPIAILLINRMAKNDRLHSDELYIRPVDDPQGNVRITFAITPGDTLLIYDNKTLDVFLMYHFKDSVLTVDPADRIEVHSGPEIANMIRRSVYMTYPFEKRVIRK